MVSGVCGVCQCATMCQCVVCMMHGVGGVCQCVVCVPVSGVCGRVPVCGMCCVCDVSWCHLAVGECGGCM